MPKVILEFNLPDDKYELVLTQKGPALYLALKDFDQFLRNKIKYEELSELQIKIYQEMRDQLGEYCEDNGFNLYTLGEE